MAYLQDDRDAWDLMPDGHYKRVKGAGEPKGHGAQDALDGALCRARRSRAGGNMDLILWRHAEAQDEDESGDDLKRSLTARGEKQAARMAAWLDRHLPEGTRILCSPARALRADRAAAGPQVQAAGRAGARPGQLDCCWKRPVGRDARQPC